MHTQIALMFNVPCERLGTTTRVIHPYPCRNIPEPGIEIGSWQGESETLTVAPLDQGPYTDQQGSLGKVMRLAIDLVRRVR